MIKMHKNLFANSIRHRFNYSIFRNLVMITIIGAGKVGGDAALFSALRRLDDEILLLDIADGLPQGEAMDLNHMLSEQGIDVNVKGSNNYEDMKGSKIVVVVAGCLLYTSPSPRDRG